MSGMSTLDMYIQMIKHYWTDIIPDQNFTESDFYDLIDRVGAGQCVGAGPYADRVAIGMKRTPDDETLYTHLRFTDVRTADRFARLVQEIKSLARGGIKRDSDPMF